MSKISLDPKIEKALIKKCKKNKKAFGILYKHYKDHIYKFILSKVTEEETAKDLTSNVFKKALEGIASFKWQGISFSAWLYRIAKNTVIDHYRSSNKHKKNVSIYKMAISTNDKNPEESLIYSEFEEKIEKLLSELPSRERQIIYMKFFEGYTNKTISGLMSLSETNVGTILHRTIKKLRKTFHQS